MNFITPHFFHLLAGVGIAVFVACAVFCVVIYECHRHEREREDSEKDL